MECYGIPRAFQHIDVRVGWRPARVVRATVIMSKPGGGELVKRLVPVSGAARDLPSIGLQSVRNPRGIPDPAPRPTVKGPDGRDYAWAISRAGTRCGWIAVEDYGPDPLAATRPPLLGPAGKDFEVGRTLPQLKRPSGCGKVSLTTPLRRVIARETFVRYSPRGSGFHYAHRDDLVRLLIVNAPAGFAFCELVRVGPGSSLKPGMRGWILQEALGPVV